MKKGKIKTNRNLVRKYFKQRFVEALCDLADATDKYIDKHGLSTFKVWRMSDTFTPADLLSGCSDGEHKNKGEV